jgi:hypothetical protein
MITRKRIDDNDPIQAIASRLAQLGLLPHQVQKHIDAIEARRRPKPKPVDPHRPESSPYDGWTCGVCR